VRIIHIQEIISFRDGNYLHSVWFLSWNRVSLKRSQRHHGGTEVEESIKCKYGDII